MSESTVRALEQFPASYVDVNALIVAAAGRHNVFLLSTSPESRFARNRLARALPTLSPSGGATPYVEASSSTSTHNLFVHSGLEDDNDGGLVTRADGGILMLDEAASCAPRTLDAIAGIQKTKVHDLFSGKDSTRTTYPADFQMVLTSGMCACGAFGTRACRCTPKDQGKGYLGRLAGPLMMCTDIRVRVSAISPVQPSNSLTSTEAATQVGYARAKAAHRLEGTPWRFNSEVSSDWLHDSQNRPTARSTVGLDEALRRGEISFRQYDRVLRVAWTLADLDQVERPDFHHVAAATQMGAHPLSMVASLEAEQRLVKILGAKPVTSTPADPSPVSVSMGRS